MRTSWLAVALVLAVLGGIVAISPSTNAQTAAKAKTYTFDPTKPPLLKDLGGNIIDIPTSDLTRQIGTTTWTDVSSAPGGSGVFGAIITNKTTHNYNISRYQHWVISQAPMHFSIDQTYDVKTVVGYSTQQRDQIEKTTTLDFEAGGDFAGIKLSASEKNDLKVTSETTVQWSTQTTTDVQTKFKAGTTFVLWSLLDTLQIDEVTSVQMFLNGSGGQQPFGPPSVTQASGTLDNVLANYQDLFVDQKSDAVTALTKKLAVKPSAAPATASGASVQAIPDK
jgi:hypothetical protein